MVFQKVFGIKMVTRAEKREQRIERNREKAFRREELLDRRAQTRARISAWKAQRKTKSVKWKRNGPKINVKQEERRLNQLIR